MSKQLFITFAAGFAAIKKCKGGYELREHVELCEDMLRTQQFRDIAKFYTEMQKQFDLILDASGTGPFAEKKKAELDAL